ncbi:putative pterin-binding protein [Enterobacter vonholyi]
MSKHYSINFMKARYTNILPYILFFLIPYSFAQNNDVLLTIKSNDKSIELTENDFKKIKRSSVTTKNSWSNKATFEGVSIKDILIYTNIEGNSLTFHALNDYWVEIPMLDIKNYNPLLADSKDGKNFTTRDFGPFWVVYPIDEYPDELNKPIYGGRSIWQIDSISVK